MAKTFEIESGLFKKEIEFLRYCFEVRHTIVHRGGEIDRKFIGIVKRHINSKIHDLIPEHDNLQKGSLISVTLPLINELKHVCWKLTGYLTLNIMKKYLGFEGISEDKRIKFFPDKEIIEKNRK